MNLIDYLGGIAVILFGSIFSVIGLGLIFQRFRDRKSERFRGEIAGNEWHSDSAEMGGAFHSRIRVMTDSGLHEFVDESGQIPKRSVGNHVEVVRDPKTGEFRILRSWALTWLLALAFLVAGILTVTFTWSSCHRPHESEANKAVVGKR
ncbi:MAG: hypothetical protein P1V20_32490 [Verrucomicrobiales bacterium]|nr:hypothetical protein [Verrucomicrobiales bacterium]